MNLKVSTKGSSFKADNWADIKAGVNKMLAASPGEAIDINALGVHTKTKLNPKGYALERYYVKTNYLTEEHSRHDEGYNWKELCEVVDELVEAKQLPLRITEFEADDDADDPIAEIIIYK